MGIGFVVLNKLLIWIRVLRISFVGPSDVVLTLVLTGFSGGKLSQKVPNPSIRGGWLNCRTGVVALFVFLGFCLGVVGLF